MVVLAVTWMAKIGRESEVAAIFEKLSAESRKEPGCLMYQVHKHKTDPRRFFRPTGRDTIDRRRSVAGLAATAAVLPKTLPLFIRAAINA